MGGHGRPLLGWYGSDAEHVNQGAFPQDFIDEFLVPNWERVDQLGVMVRHGSAHGHGTHTHSAVVLDAQKVSPTVLDPRSKESMHFVYAD